MKIAPLLILPLLIFTGGGALCQQHTNDSVRTFKVRKAAPEIKALYSKTNTLYEGKNPLILDGVDSLHMAQYYLYTSKFIPVYRQQNRFYIDINLYAISHDIITIPGSIRVFIYKADTPDTVLIGWKEMDIAKGELPDPTVMVGANPLIPERESKKDLLANPSLSFVSANSDYNSCFRVSSFAITIGSITYTCRSNTLSPEILNALKKYRGKYVTVNYLYASTPEGLSFCFIENRK